MYANSQLEEVSPEPRQTVETTLARLAVGPYNGDALAIEGLARVHSLSPAFTQSLVDYYTDLSALRSLPKVKKRRRRS
jgi:hypothetical protein